MEMNSKSRGSWGIIHIDKGNPEESYEEINNAYVDG